MITTLLKKLAFQLQKAGTAHKKKLIFTAIMLLGAYVAKRRLKIHHIINLALFFVKFWTNVISLLPIPKFAQYRNTVSTFEYQEEIPIHELTDLMNLNKILAKIKRRQSGSLDQLKFSILSGVVMTFVLYNAESFFNLVLKKYIEDFADLSAAYSFQKTIDGIKQKFKDNFEDAKKMIQTTLHEMIKSVQASDLFDISSVECLLRKMLDRIFEETQDKSKRIKYNHMFQKDQIQFKRAKNYFQTTLQFIEPKQQESNKTTKIIMGLFKPLGWIGKGLSAIVEVPQEQIADQSYFCHQYLYILPLKKYRDQQQWPNAESKYLSVLVIEQIDDFYRSTNFCTFSRLRAHQIMLIFINRMQIYFLKRAGSEKKRLIDLLPIFSKILKQQILQKQRKQELYERQIALSLRDTISKPKSSTLKDIAIRNKILQEIYKGNQLRYVDRDMQIKYFNERENIVVRPRNISADRIDEKQEIQEFLGSYEKANDEKAPQKMIEEIKNSFN